MTREAVVNSLEAARALAAKAPDGFEPLIWNAGYVVLDTRPDPPTINEEGDPVHTIRAKPPLARIEDWRVIFMPEGWRGGPAVQLADA